jgi:hypothetical protein
MQTFSTTELSQMRATQAGAMYDTCKVLAYSAIQDALGNPDVTWTAGSALACGFEPVKPGEVHGSGDVPVIDGRVRLPIGTSVDEQDRIRMTHRYGEVLASSEDYEVVGPVMRGPSGLVVSVRLVTG